MIDSDEDSQPLEFPSDNEDTKPDKDTRPVPRLPSEDSMDHFLERPLSEQIDVMIEETEDDRKNRLSFVFEDLSEPPITPEKPYPEPKITKRLTEFEKRERRNRLARERRKEKKKAEEIEDGDGGDKGEDGGKKRKQHTGSTKRKKERYQKETEDEDEDEDEPPKRFPVYLFIEGPRPFAAPASRSKPATSVPPPLVIQKGPFFHLVTSSFSSLKRSIANHMPCNLDLLSVPSFMWKYDKPANGTRMQLTTEVGYEALINSVKKKKSETIVFIYMKPPAKDIGWPTGDPKQVDDPFDFDQVAAAQVPEGLGRKEQIAAIALKSAEHEAKLLERYPIGTHPSWPEKRVWQHPDHVDHVWELIPIRLRVWASSIATGQSDYNKPPTSNHFNDDKRLRKPRRGAAPLADAQPAPEPLPPAVPPNWQQYMWPPYHQFPPPFGFPPQAYPLPPQQPGHAPPYPGNLYAPILARPPSTHSSPGSVAPHNISLADFCSRYKISDSDQAKLAELEYEPGDKIVESLEENDWKSVSFSVIGRKRFLAAHRQFRKDLKTGVWDAA